MCGARGPGWPEGRDGGRGGGWGWGVGVGGGGGTGLVGHVACST